MIINLPWLPFDAAGAVLGKRLIILTKDADEFTLAHERYHQVHWKRFWVAKWLFLPMFRMRVEWDATLYEYTLRYRYISGLDAWIRARAYETVRDGYWLTKRAKEELAELLTGAT